MLCKLWTDPFRTSNMPLTKYCCHIHFSGLQHLPSLSPQEDKQMTLQRLATSTYHPSTFTKCCQQHQDLLIKMLWTEDVDWSLHTSEVHNHQQSLHCPGVTQAQCGMSHGQYILYQPAQQGQTASAVLAKYKLPRNSISDYRPDVQQLAGFSHPSLFKKEHVQSIAHRNTYPFSATFNKNKRFCWKQSSSSVTAFCSFWYIQQTDLHSYLWRMSRLWPK